MERVRESGVAEVSVGKSWRITDIFVHLWKDKYGFCEKKWGIENTQKGKHFLE